MKPIRFQVFAIVLISFLSIALSSGCATNKAVAPMPEAPQGFVLIREYVDSFKTDKGDEYRKVQLGWDYARKSAVEKMLSVADGGVVSEKTIEALTLRASDAEMEYAYALVRNHKELAKKLKNRTDTRFYGGFSLREPNGSCAQGSRCVHVMVSAGVEGQESLAHAIVDLAARKVVNPNYQGQFPSGIEPSNK